MKVLEEKDISPQSYDQMRAVLAEIGMLLNAIRARDGAPYYDARYHQGHTAYMDEASFDALVERLSAAVGGDILRAYWDTRSIQL